MDSRYLQRFLSDSARGATRNEIRELLKLIARPEIISLAGGLPPPESFPFDDFAEILPELLRTSGSAALQYGPTEGDPGLKAELIRILAESEGGSFRELTTDHLLVTSASQQGLDLCSRCFISTNDSVVVGLPTYLGALGAFTSCGAKLSGVPLDRLGMRSDLLEQRLVDLRRQGIHPKLLYTVPDFGNPSGVTMSLKRREQILSIAREFDLLVIEDSPYRELRYRGEAQPMLYDLDRDSRVISLFTFSKTLSPGLRLGWVVADPQVISRLAVTKQPVDLCTSGLLQALVREFLRAGRLPRQIRRIREMYAAKRLAILEALEECFAPEWGVTWTRPEGGLFLWMELPAWMDARELLEAAINEEKVAFVAGAAFHCDGSGRNTLRLNFSFPSEEKLRDAIARLARCVERRVATRPLPAPEKAPRAWPLLVGGDHALVHLPWNLGLCEVVE